MKLTRLVTRFTYRIEPKAGGGFVAHASDPNVPPLEAATREELQAKIQDRVSADLATEFPGLKVSLDRPGRKFAFHIEVKPGGGFTLHSADPNALPVEGATHDDLHSYVAERLSAIAGKQGGPELALGLQSDTPASVDASALPLGQTASTGLTSGASSDVRQAMRISSTLGPVEAGGTPAVVRAVLTLIAIGGLIYLFFVFRR